MPQVKRKMGEIRPGTANTRALLYPQSVSAAKSESNLRKGAVLAQSASRTVTSPETSNRESHTKVPVITGEAHYKGSVVVEGLLSGQLGANSGCLTIKQNTCASFAARPQLDGELNFKDVMRVSGYIAGSVSSESGTIIVDVGARVDANIDVAVALISGVVNGDVVARERVEIGPLARMRGNIWTRSIMIKDGAIFEGVCRMTEET